VDYINPFTAGANLAIGGSPLTGQNIYFDVTTASGGLQIDSFPSGNGFLNADKIACDTLSAKNGTNIDITATTAFTLSNTQLITSTVQIGPSTILTAEPDFPGLAVRQADDSTIAQVNAAAFVIGAPEDVFSGAYTYSASNDRATVLNSSLQTKFVAYLDDLQNIQNNSVSTNTLDAGTGNFSTIETATLTFPTNGVIQTLSSKLYLSSYDSVNIQADGTTYIGDGGAYRGSLDAGQLDSQVVNTDTLSTGSATVDALTVSSINSQPYQPFSGGQYYRTSNQNLPNSGTTYLNFDASKSWTSADFIQTEPSTFLCSTSGTYQIGINTTILAASGTWTTLGKSISITQDRGGVQSVAVNTTNASSGANYGQGMSAMLDIQQGDLLRFGTGQTLVAGSTISLGLANVFDYNTFWDYQLLRKD
jgi:hypothetical protein